MCVVLGLFDFVFKMSMCGRINWKGGSSNWLRFLGV